ncbi:O-antigen ligase family protein [Adhaeribacter terreus]|uniref:O-antigen ligase family protein n=1 Tax=Adhaeribacter terreus TaxID=529703 RepID=A0ABW0EGL3_9BACT
MGKSFVFLQKINVPQAAFFFCCLIVTGMLTTNFLRILSSIGNAGLLLTAFVSLAQQNNISNLRKYPYFLGFMLIYLVHLLGFMQPEISSMKDLQRDLVMKLPLLILPFSFAVLPAISRPKLKQLFYLFVICVFLGSVYSMGYYLNNFEAVNEQYTHSEVMKTPTNHVRYSLMVAFAILVGFRLWLKGFFVFGKWERKLLLFITVWLFIFLHILAVRSGLVVFYAAAGLGLAFDFFFRKQYLRSFFAGVGLIMALLAAFYTLPTFYNKFFLTIADVNRVSDEDSAHDYSITGRVYSYKVAMEVFEESPVFGVGIGNLDKELGDKYTKLFPEILERGHLLPHNQFIFALVAFGIVGLVIFLVCFYYPLFRFAGRFEPLFFFHYLIITLSCMFESTFETQVGLMFSIVFILLWLWYFKAGPEQEETWKNGTFFSPKTT